MKFFYIFFNAFIINSVLGVRRNHFIEITDGTVSVCTQIKITDNDELDLLKILIETFQESINIHLLFRCTN